MHQERTEAETPKHRLKQLAKDNGLSIQDLLALAPQNDPFNCGGPEQIKQANWFAENWKKLMGVNRGHLRKFHYKAVSQKTPILKPDGTPYQNTFADWERLQTWSKYARYLGLVDPQQIIDARNPEPHLFAPDPVEPDSPSWSISDWDGFSLPGIRTYMWSDFSLPQVSVEGYQYRSGEQPYLLELWVEKSTMDEEFIPICQKLGINLVTSTGFQSVTGAVAALSRAGAWAALGRPVRIFYISDFDPAGDLMPVAVSRQIEFWHQQYGDGVDLKLTPLALTKAQVVEYDLPTIPIKESDKRGDAFTEKHGVDGAVELDALEAIHPGELSRIIEEAVSVYIDKGLRIELIDVAAEAQANVESAWEDYIDDLEDEADRLKQEAERVVEKFKPQLESLSEEFASEMEPIREAAEALQEEMHSRIRNADSINMELELPDRPMATVEPPDESDWLYSSERSFGEQLARYKTRKEGQ